MTCAARGNGAKQPILCCGSTFTCLLALCEYQTDVAGLIRLIVLEGTYLPPHGRGDVTHILLLRRSPFCFGGCKVQSFVLPNQAKLRRWICQRLPDLWRDRMTIEYTTGGEPRSHTFTDRISTFCWMLPPHAAQFNRDGSANTGLHVVCYCRLFVAFFLPSVLLSELYASNNTTGYIISS